MTDITALAQRMRAAAEKAKHAGEAPVMNFCSRIDALNEFQLAACPANVLALVEALEKAQSKAASEPVAWTEKCEITNMRATGLYLRGFPDNSQGRDIALYTVSPALESRTVTVKLPKRSVAEVMLLSGFDRQYAEGWCSGNDNAIHEMRAAGIQVIEGEGQ